MKKIDIKGKSYDLAFTLGAMRHYKEFSGCEFEEIHSVRQMGDFLYSCAVCGEKRAGRRMDLDAEAFLDELDFATTAEVFASLIEGAGMKVEEGEEKKKE